MAIFARENAASRCLTEHYVWQIVTATGVKTLFSIFYSCHVSTFLKCFFYFTNVFVIKNVCVVCYVCSRAMQHGSIIAQEALTTIQYAESYVF